MLFVLLKSITTFGNSCMSDNSNLSPICFSVARICNVKVPFLALTEIEALFSVPNSTFVIKFSTCMAD